MGSFLQPLNLGQVGDFVRGKVADLLFDRNLAKLPMLTGAPPIRQGKFLQPGQDFGASCLVRLENFKRGGQVFCFIFLDPFIPNLCVKSSGNS